MSAIAAILQENCFAIATDTLGYKHFQDGTYEKCRYQSKMQYFPVQKTCVVSMGYSRLKSDLFRFVDEKLIAIDIEEMVAAIRNEFLDFIDTSNYQYSNQPLATAEQIGNLEFFGYSTKRNKLVYYRLEVDRDHINFFEEDDFTGGNMITHPRIKDDARAKILETNTRADKILIEAMKEMYSNCQGETCMVPLLGGEVIMAVLSLNFALDDPFSCTIYTAHEFDDYRSTIKNLQEMAAGPGLPDNAEEIQNRIDSIQAEIDSLNALNI
jgi:hypothetical protein